jgi:hypothetical protein
VIILKDNKDSERKGERSYAKPNISWKHLSDAVRVENGCFQEACSSQMPGHMIQYNTTLYRRDVFLQVVADILEKCSASVFRVKQSKEPVRP